MRRGGARREVSTRVFLRSEDGAVLLEGWALNVSRGGVRAILEQRVELGQEFEIEVGTDDGTARRGRIVWMQEELDGVIVGIEFTGLSGALRAAPAVAELAEFEEDLREALDESESPEAGAEGAAAPEKKT
jgi:hypothetical protein